MRDDGREEILARIRKGTGSRGPKSPVAAARSIRPALQGDVLGIFKAKAETNLFAVHSIETMADVPAAVAKIARDNNIAGDVSVAPSLGSLFWPQTMTVRTGKARVEEKLTVVRACAGIAETGTLVVCSGDDAPSSLTFAGEVSVIVLQVSEVVPYLEDGLARVRARYDPWPRAVNLVSGPSRTADIAGIVVRPAHGPKAVHVLLAGG